MAKPKLVSKYYQMNPETDELISSENLLAGMIVLLEDSDQRVDVSSGFYEDAPAWMVSRALERNRWCMISDVKIVGVAEERVWFTATYEDGSKQRRTYDVKTFWLRKSIYHSDMPKAEESNTYKVPLVAYSNGVRKIVGEAELPQGVIIDGDITLGTIPVRAMITDSDLFRVPMSLMDPPQDEKTDKYTQVLDLVVTAISAQDTATTNGDHSGMQTVAGEVTKKIVELFN